MRPVATRHVRLALRCYKSQGGLIPPRLKIFPARPVILNYLEQDFGPCIMLWPLGGLFQATASPGSLLLIPRLGGSALKRRNCNLSNVPIPSLAIA